MGQMLVAATQDPSHLEEGTQAHASTLVASLCSPSAPMKDSPLADWLTAVVSNLARAAAQMEERRGFEVQVISKEAEKRLVRLLKDIGAQSCYMRYRHACACRWTAHAIC